MLDTNVIIDYLGRRAPFFENAKDVIASGYFGDAKLWMAAQSAADALCVLSRYAASEQIQCALLHIFEVVEPVSLTAVELTRAAQLGWSDYEDRLIALSAQKADASFIITRDETGFDASPIATLSPAQWSERMAEAGISYAERAL